MMEADERADEVVEEGMVVGGLRKGLVDSPNLKGSQSPRFPNLIVTAFPSHPA